MTKVDGIDLLKCCCRCSDSAEIDLVLSDIMACAGCLGDPDSGGSFEVTNLTFPPTITLTSIGGFVWTATGGNLAVKRYSAIGCVGAFTTESLDLTFTVECFDGMYRAEVVALSGSFGTTFAVFLNGTTYPLETDISNLAVCNDGNPVAASGGTITISLP